MQRPVRLALTALTIVLVLMPLSAGRPGQPPTMKADEPGYFLAGLSLAFDRDLRCDQHDIDRAFDHYQYFPVDNLILMSPDGWDTVYFGKPYIYSFLAAPLAAIAGPRGFVVFNMLLYATMIWMGAIYLRRFNSDARAALYSSLFFLLSAAFTYNFWIHPEVLNMFAIAACLFFAFHDPSRNGTDEEKSGWTRALTQLTAPGLRPIWSGAVLALAVYNKPMLALLGVPALFVFYRRRGWKAAITWIVAAVVAMALIAGISVAFTGKPSAYLGVSRGGINADRSTDFANGIEEVRKATAARKDPNPNSWQWMFRIPTVHGRKFLGDLNYFLMGRHTGLVPYMPFAVLSMVLFMLYGRRSRARWLLLGAAAATALVFLLWIPFNWHGGGGFVGNRYYVNVYPAFLFLVTAARPALFSMVTAGFATLTVGSLVFAPWGLAVPKGSLQAHTRGGIYSLFPPELTFHSRISGYESFGVEDVGMVVREDLTNILSKEEGIFQVRGAVDAEIWAFGKEPLEKVFFEVRTPQPDNEIRIRHAGQTHTVRFESAGKTPDRKVVEIPLRNATRVWDIRGEDKFFYRLRVRPKRGLHAGGNMRDVVRNPIFYNGARLTLLGSENPETARAKYRMSWQRCEIPETAAVGSRMTIPIKVTNTGTSSWSSGGRNEMRFTYAWLDANGDPLPSPNFRETRIRADVAPQSDYATTMILTAPRTAGIHTLVLEGSRRRIGRFGPSPGGACRGSVRVEGRS